MVPLIKSIPAAQQPAAAAQARSDVVCFILTVIHHSLCCVISNCLSWHCRKEKNTRITAKTQHHFVLRKRPLCSEGDSHSNISYSLAAPLRPQQFPLHLLYLKRQRNQEEGGMSWILVQTLKQRTQQEAWRLVLSISPPLAQSVLPTTQRLILTGWGESWYWCGRVRASSSTWYVRTEMRKSPEV